MTHTHKLSTQNHFDFLNQERKDPITGDLIKENDEIVICSSCKSAFLKDSWEYLGNTHCEQNDTLIVIPERSKLELKSGLLTSLLLTAKEDILTNFLTVLVIELVILIFLYLILGNSFFILLIGLLILLLPIAIGVLITPVTNVDLYGSYLLSIGMLGKTKIDYENIKHVVVTYNNLEKDSNSIHIMYTNRGTYNIPLNKKNGHLSKNEELSDFISYLSRYTKVILK